MSFTVNSGTDGVGSSADVCSKLTISMFDIVKTVMSSRVARFMLFPYNNKGWFTIKVFL